MRTWLAPVVGVALVLAGVLGAVAVTLFMPSRPGTWDDATRHAGGVDSMFIEEMIPHHDDAIAMAEIGIERAEHPELRELARDITRVQSAQNEQMRDWYSEWFDADVPEGGGGMMGGMMGGDVDLEEFEDADPFDKAFIEEMVPHHRMAIMMARMLRSQTDEPQMRQFANRIIETQSEEIDRMLSWYDEWYGRP
ncbi:DUF305 domain-containing protein [bacterium]|nr:DUF305 domain-containing protein [bacterium]